MAVIGATAARAAQSLQTVDIDVDLANDTYKVAGIEYKLAEGTDKAGTSGIPFVILPRGARVLGGSVFTQEQIVAGDAVVGIDLLDPDTNTPVLPGCGRPFCWRSPDVVARHSAEGSVDQSAPVRRHGCQADHERQDHGEHPVPRVGPFGIRDGVI